MSVPSRKRTDFTNVGVALASEVLL